MMPISAIGGSEGRVPAFAGTRGEGSSGFTLIELLVVLTIIGLLSAAVVLGMPDPRGRLVGEAERFAARAQAAQERALTGGRPTAVRLTEMGYSFERREGGAWRPLGEEEAGRWSAAEEVQAEGNRIVFDTTGMAEPAELQLIGGGQRVTVTVALDGSVRVGA